MLFPRMAAGRARLLLWATTIPLIAVSATETASASSTTGFNLGSDITAFIPSCAVSCFESFLEVNFDTDLCGSSPSLQCLCPHTGSTGYTIGEGAVQCIVAENSIRACSGMSAGSDTVANAYDMCNNQPSAAPATHATIIATLIVPPTGPVVVPNPSPTGTASSNKSSTTSYMTPSVTMEPTLSTISVPSSSSTFITRTSSSSSASSSAPSTATAAPQTSETGAAAAPTRLSTAQIGGIAGGSAAAVLVAGVLAFWCFMRRRRGKAVTGFYRVRDSWSPQRKESPKISAPQYREAKSMSFTRALAQRANRASARPDTIGLAISPEGTGMQGAARQPGGSMVAANVPPVAHLAQRRSPSPPPIPALSPLRTQGNFNFFASQGQPSQQQNQQTSAAKPNLTVAIPAAKPQQANRSSTMSNNRMPFSGGRDSVVTEFAEDGETSAGLGSAQIWRPPNTDPQSASTYYVADKWGNWVLGGGSRPEEHLVEMPTPVSKTIAERDAEQDRAVKESNAVKAAVKDLSSPTLGAPVAVSVSRPAGAPSRPTIRHVAPESGRLPINTRSSSVYSNFSMNFSLPQTVQPGPDNPMPSSAGSRKEPSPNPESYYAGGGAGAGGKQQGRDLTSRHRRGSSSGGGATRDRTNTMMSQDSTTTIASSIGSEVGVDAFPAPSRQSAATEQQGNLSPVVESPGRSPVSYPKIPRPRSNAPLNRPAEGPPMMKPLQHPALRVVNSTPSDSPTLGLVESQKPVQVGSPPAAAAPAQARVSYYNPPRMNPNPNRNPGQVRSGSPETPSDQPIPRPLAVPSNKRDTTKSPPLQSSQQHINNRSQLPSQSHSRYGPMSVYDAYSRPDSNPPPQQQQPLARQQPSKQQQQYYYQQQQQQQQQQPSQQYQYQNEPGGPYSFSPSPSPSPASASQSPSVSNTTIKTDSQSSLLAAKRLGAERAAALQIGQGDTVEARRARWQRRTSSLGKTGPVDADAGAPRGVIYRQAGKKPTTRESDVPLPATPGWKPQLTPKRRGDDLFLSVQ